MYTLICYSTPNYAPITTLFMKSLQTYRGKPFRLYHKLDSSMPVQKDGFQTPLWYYCVLHKIKHLVSILEAKAKEETKAKEEAKAGYIVFSDCDVSFLGQNAHLWSSLFASIDSSMDIVFMREGITTDVNTGFFIMRQTSVSRLIPFFENVISVMEQTPPEQMPLGDQTIINSLKNNIRYGFIPNEYVVFGNHIYNANRALIHHAIGCTTIEEKVKHLESFRLPRMGRFGLGFT